MVAAGPNVRCALACRFLTLESSALVIDKLNEAYRTPEIVFDFFSSLFLDRSEQSHQSAPLDLSDSILG